MSRPIKRVLKWSVRRELHHSRTPSSVVVAVVLVLLLLVGATVAFAHLISVEFGSFVKDIVDWVMATPVVFIPAGIVFLIFGLWAFFNSILPGRRAREGRYDERSAIIIDAEVMANAVAESVARGVGVSRKQVDVVVNRKTVHVTVHPVSGVPVDEALAAQLAEEVTKHLGFPRRARVTVSERGELA